MMRAARPSPLLRAPSMNDPPQPPPPPPPPPPSPPPPRKSDPWVVLRGLVVERRSDFLVGAVVLAASSACAAAIPQCIRGASNALRDGRSRDGMLYASAIVLFAALGAWARVTSRVRIFNGGR